MEREVPCGISGVMSAEEKDSVERIALHMKSNLANAFVDVHSPRHDQDESIPGDCNPMRIFGTHFLDLSLNPDGIADALQKGSVAESRKIHAYTWDGKNAKPVQVLVFAHDILMLGDGWIVLPAHQPQGYTVDRLTSWALMKIMRASLQAIAHSLEGVKAHENHECIGGSNRSYSAAS